MPCLSVAKNREMVEKGEQVDGTTTLVRSTETKARGTFVLYGRFVLALLALTSIIVGQLPSRVYFPFEQAVLPPSDAFARLHQARYPSPLPKPARIIHEETRIQRAKYYATARARFHQARIDALAEVIITRYGKWHKAKRRNVGIRKLIWVGSGNKYGFGDRFRGIIHAYLCAVVTGRLLVIKWDSPFALTTIFESSTLDMFWDGSFDGPDFQVCNHGVAVKSGECKMLNETSIYETIYPFGGLPHCYCTLNELDLLESDLPTVVLRSEMSPSIRRLFHAVHNSRKLPDFAQPLIEISKTWTKNHSEIIGRIDGPTPADDAALFALIFKAILRPSTEFLEMLGRQRKEVRSFIPARLFQTRLEEEDEMTQRTHKHVSIHARLGIGLGEKDRYWNRFGKMKIDMMAACMAGHAAEEADRLDLGEPQRFYIATDTVEFVLPLKRWLRARSKGAIIVEGVGEMDKVHSNKLSRTSERDRRRFLLTATDLFFLSAGETLISFRSGFSNLAAWFSGKQHKIVTVEQCVREKWLERATEFGD